MAAWKADRITRGTVMCVLIENIDTKKALRVFDKMCDKRMGLQEVMEIWSGEEQLPS